MNNDLFTDRAYISKRNAYMLGSYAMRALINGGEPGCEPANFGHGYTSVSGAGGCLIGLNRCKIWRLYQVSECLGGRSRTIVGRYLSLRGRVTDWGINTNDVTLHISVRLNLKSSALRVEEP